MRYVKNDDVTVPDSHWRWCLDDWVQRGPSRRLRKLYRELADVEREREAVRNSNPVPGHAPSSYVFIRERMRPLDERLCDLQRRIALLQNDAE